MIKNNYRNYPTSLNNVNIFEELFYLITNELLCFFENYTLDFMQLPFIFIRTY